MTGAGSGRYLRGAVIEMVRTSELVHDPHTLPSFASLASTWREQVRAYGESTRAFRAMRARRHQPRRGVAWRGSAAMETVSDGVNWADLRAHLDREQEGPVAVEAPTLTVVPPSEDPPAAASQIRAVVASPGPLDGRLTRRQTEIAHLIAQGLTNSQIAQQLILTPGTVGNHVEHILRRLGMNNRAQVAAWIVRASASPPPPSDALLS